MIPDRNDFFREVTLRISSSLNITEALRSLFGYLERFMPIDTIGLHRVDMNRQVIFSVAEITRTSELRLVQENNPMIRVDTEFWDLVRETRQNQSLVTVYNDARDLPAPVRQCFPQLETRSVIVLHLSIKYEPIGGLTLSTEGRGKYREQHVELLECVKEPIALAMSNAWRYHELERLRDQLAEDHRALSMEIERAAGVQVVGADFGLSQVMDMVRRVAPLASPVLLLGETGAGKEVIANAIHLSSGRSGMPMLRVQCGAIPETLLDSELFGHEKGAFTGALTRKRGRFERAHGGTIFLDEIGELSGDAQVKLLRVLQDGEFERVGGTETLNTDVRVIAATHRNLAQMVQQGRFREDLFYRLNVFPIQIPPLRMRRMDIAPLVHYFVERKAREMHLDRVPTVNSETISRLCEYDWPGNVRELQNVVERAIILGRGTTLEFPDLEIPTAAKTASEPVTRHSQTTIRSLDDVMADHIRQTLTATSGRIAGPGGAAERLNINPGTLRSRMKKLGITITRRPERNYTPATDHTQ